MLTVDTMEKWQRRWVRNVTTKVRRLGRVLHGGLLLGAGLLVLALGQSGQGQELFRVLLEGEQQFNVGEVIGILAATVLSGLLFFTYLSFTPEAGTETRTYSRLNHYIGRIGLFAITVAPWAAGLLSVYQMRAGLQVVRANLMDNLPNKKGFLVAPVDLPPPLLQAGGEVVDMIDAISTRSNYALGVIGLLGIIVWGLLFLSIMPRRRSRYRLEWTVGLFFFLAASAILIVLGFAAALFDLTFVDFYKWIGPLAAGLITAIGLFSLAALVSLLARAFGVPVYLAVVGLFLVAGLNAREWSFWGGFGRTAAISQSLMTTVPPPQPTFDCALRAWIAAQDDPGRTGRHDCADDVGSGPIRPMFVVSAQGGGMYAAMTSALFLARLRQADRKFESSVFAISAVSGGAIGAAMFNDCGGHSGNDEAELKQILLDHHFSAIVGNLLPDVLRKYTSLFGYRADRADAFTQSLVEKCAALGERYDRGWTAGGGKPALVLNTTWMSNGHRVAFAPFGLHDMSTGDGTSWSFGDLYGNSGLEKLTPMRNGRPFEPSVADAAVASARFPGILPPLSLTVRVPTVNSNGVEGTRLDRHNFGDGGYGDASGVTTALEMFDAARASQAHTRIAPQLIVITFDYTKVTPENSPDTQFVDTWAPVAATLGVRANLSGVAIARAERQAVDNGNSHLLRVSVDPEKLGLALGFELSRTTYEIISLLIGHSDWCPDPKRTYDNPKDKSYNPILANSCAARRIKDLLKPANG